jgi:arginine utilization protein RocB
VKLLSYKSIIFTTTIILLTGCGNDYFAVEKKSKIEINDKVTKYCEANHYSFCEIYARCYNNVASYLSLSAKYKLKFISEAASDPQYSPNNTMDIVYSKLKDSESKLKNSKEKSKEDLILYYSSVLYPHNKCSSIIGAKQYDISRHNDIIQKSLDQKRSRVIIERKRDE